MRERKIRVILGQALPLCGLWFVQLANEGVEQMDSEGTDSTSILWKAAGNSQ